MMTMTMNRMFLFMKAELTERCLCVNQLLSTHTGPNLPTNPSQPDQTMRMMTMNMVMKMMMMKTVMMMIDPPKEKMSTPAIGHGSKIASVSICSNNLLLHSLSGQIEVKRLVHSEKRAG